MTPLTCHSRNDETTEAEARRAVAGGEAGKPEEGGAMGAGGDRAALCIGRAQADVRVVMLQIFLHGVTTGGNWANGRWDLPVLFLTAAHKSIIISKYT